MKNNQSYTDSKINRQISPRMSGSHLTYKGIPPHPGATALSPLPGGRGGNLNSSRANGNKLSPSPAGEKVGVARMRGRLFPCRSGVSLTTKGLIPHRHAELVSASGRSINGFTLIELLVVVLITGILAAVALPQYQKAVQKAHITQELAVFNAYKKAINVWLLENPWPTTGRIYFTGNATGNCAGYSLSSLDIDFPNSTRRGCDDGIGNVSVQAWVSVTNAGIFTTYFENGDYQDGLKACHAQFQLQKGTTEWNLAAILYKGVNSANLATAEQCPDYQKLMCQYWATQGTGLGRPATIAQCARWGVTLTQANPID